MYDVFLYSNKEESFLVFLLEILLRNQFARKDFRSEIWPVRNMTCQKYDRHTSSQAACEQVFAE